MKYQDNFYFASFLYRALTQPNPEPNPRNSCNENLNPNLKARKIKVTPPLKKVEMKVAKEAPPEVTVEDLEALQPGSQRKLKEIEAVLVTRGTGERLDHHHLHCHAQPRLWQITDDFTTPTTIPTSYYPTPHHHRRI